MARPRVPAPGGPVPAAYLAGRYELQGVIGSGGMATVHRAWDHRLERPVAIKLLAPQLASDPVVRRRFGDEANAAARIAHRNVVTTFDTDEADGDPFIVMECLSGVTLASEIAQGRLGEERIRSIALEALAGLQAAHSLGIVHRDIKPSNLLIGPDGSIEIADFGIAKSISGADHTATGDVLGSVAYMAPERLEGEPATFRSDLYSLGVVLYQAAAGHKPFAGDTPAAVAHAVVATAPEPLRSSRPELDEGLTAVIERAMDRDPNARFASASEMAQALRPPELERTVSVAAPPPEPTKVFPVTRSATPPTKPRPHQRTARPDRVPTSVGSRRAWALIGLVAIAVLLVAAIVWKPGAAPTTGPAKPAHSAPPSTAPLPQQLDDALNRLEQAVRP
jgi:non-specific serine/threonine protein kinase/serine/threonine-protein kinase